MCPFDEGTVFPHGGVELPRALWLSLFFMFLFSLFFFFLSLFLLLPGAPRDRDFFSFFFFLFGLFSLFLLFFFFFFSIPPGSEG